MKSLLLLIIFLGSKTGALTDLKKELTHAKKELTRLQSRVLLLEETIAQKEIQRIEEEIANGSFLDFSSQRELLTSIIDQHPSCAFQAQIVLNQILMLITQMSDKDLDDAS